MDIIKIPFLRSIRRNKKRRSSRIYFEMIIPYDYMLVKGDSISFKLSNENTGAILQIDSSINLKRGDKLLIEADLIPRYANATITRSD